MTWHSVAPGDTYRDVHQPAVTRGCNAVRPALSRLPPVVCGWNSVRQGQLQDSRRAAGFIADDQQWLAVWSLCRRNKENSFGTTVADFANRYALGFRAFGRAAAV